MKLNDNTYKVLKWVALYLLPGITTLWLTLASIWNLPYGEQIGGTIAAIDTLVGGLLGISTAQYNKTKNQTDN